MDQSDDSTLFQPVFTQGERFISSKQIFSSSEGKKVPGRRKKKAPESNLNVGPPGLQNFRGGNLRLASTVAAGVPVPPPSSRLPTPAFGPNESPSANPDFLPHPSSFSQRTKFTYCLPSPENEKQLSILDPSENIDIATCSKEIFDKWLLAAVLAIPPSTSSTNSLRSGGIASQKAQKKFFIRESVIHNTYNVLQSAVDVLQGYLLELSHFKKLLRAYHAAVEEDAEDRKPESAKFTLFHYSMRERSREHPMERYKMEAEEITKRIQKLLFVVRRLEALEGLGQSDVSSIEDSSPLKKKGKTKKQSVFRIYGDDDDEDSENNSDEDDLDAFQDGSPEKEKILAKMKKARVIKLLATKSQALEKCLQLPTGPQDVYSRLRNELLLPLSARVLSLKDSDWLRGRDDLISAFVEWYVNKVVDPLSMSELLRIVPMEYIVTTTCRLVSACDANLSLRAAQALPDFSHVVIRSIREGRDEALSQLVLSPSVSFLAALRNRQACTVLFYAAILLGHLDVVRRVLSSGFFHPQALLVLLFFNANWENDECAGFLRYQLQLCSEMSELRTQIHKHPRYSIPSPHSNRNATFMSDNHFGARVGSPNDLRDIFRLDSRMSRRTTASRRSKEDKVASQVEAALKLFLSDNTGSRSNQVSLSDQFIYGSLKGLRALLELRERTHQQLHDLMTSGPSLLGSEGVYPSPGSDLYTDLLQKYGIDINAVGSTLRKELEGLRWHSLFGATTKVSGEGRGSNAVHISGQEEKMVGFDSTAEQASLSGEMRSQGSFGGLLRNKLLDELIGRPLSNAMLPFFSTPWLRRTDSRSFLPIAASSQPILIRSDCCLDVQEEHCKKTHLYPADESIEEKEVHDAENTRLERLQMTFDYAAATKQAGSMAEKSARRASTAHFQEARESLRCGVSKARRNQQVFLSETYTDNYYYETHVSVDFLLLIGEDIVKEKPLGAIPNPPESKNQRDFHDELEETKVFSTRLSNSFIVGFCSDNMESEAVGVVHGRSKPLGARSGSGGISFHVVGRRVLPERLLDDCATIEQIQDVVLRIVRHQNGKTFKVKLPPSKDGIFEALMNDGPSEPRSYDFTGDTGIKIIVPKDEEGKDENEEAAAYVLLRLSRKSRKFEMLDTPSSSFPSSANIEGQEGAEEPIPFSGENFFDEDKIEETTFPLTLFITETQYQLWLAYNPVKTMEGLGRACFGSEIESDAIFHKSNNSHTLKEVEPIKPKRISHSGSTQVQNFSIFGHVALAVGFFFDMPRNTVSLSINGLPTGPLFTRVGIWPVNRLFPAATLQTSSSVVDFLLSRDEAESLRATPPVLRFAYERTDVLANQLLENHIYWISDHESSASVEDLYISAQEDVAGISISNPFQNCDSDCPSSILGESKPFLSRDMDSAIEKKGVATSLTKDAHSWLGLVKLFDRTHKFKQMLSVLSSVVVKENNQEDKPPPVADTEQKGGLEASLSTILSGNVLSDGKEPGASGGGNYTGGGTEISTYQRTHMFLNYMSSGGFQDFIFFPSVHIRRRSDDGWGDLHRNGVSIIPERTALNPLCAALACRQERMAFAIASHPMTNMYHTFEAAVRQRRLALLAACALGYTEVVQVLLERMPVYEVLELFSIHIQNEELAVLRRDHRKRNILMSKSHLLKDVSPVDSSNHRGKRLYAFAPVARLDPTKMYSSKASQYTPLHVALLGGNHTPVINVLLNYLYAALSFKSQQQLSAAYCKEFNAAKKEGKIFYVGQTHPHLKQAINVSSKAGETALLISTRLNNELVMRRLVAFGASPACQDRISRAFALEIACANRYVSIAQILFSTGAYSTPLMVNHSGVATPLCWCAINNIPELISVLLKSGADPMKGLDGNNPLLLAVTFRSEEAALSLLKQCCGDQRDEVESKPGSALQRSKIRSININDVDAKTHCTTLHIACELGLVDVIRELLRLDASLTVATKSTYLTPLHTAILNGKEKAALTILEYGKDRLRRGSAVLDINALDKGGNSALHLAARAGMADVVEYIVAQYSEEEMKKLRSLNHSHKNLLPVDLTRPNNHGKHPLLIAIQFHQLKCAEHIIAYSNGKNAGGAVIDGTCTAVLQALASGQENLVLLLLSYSQFPVNPKLREEFMSAYTIRRKNIDRAEAKEKRLARRAQREANKRAKQEEAEEYRYFPPDESEEVDENELDDEESGDESDKKEHYSRPKISLFTRKGQGKLVTNYTGSLMTRAKAFCPEGPSFKPESRKSITDSGPKAVIAGSVDGKNRNLENGLPQIRSSRKHFVQELFSRTRSEISTDISLKLLLRAFALPELFVMLEEVAAESLVVGIQSPSAMVHSESMLGFLKEHFSVTIPPNNVVKFSRDLLEYIVSLFENMSATNEDLPSWYHIRDEVSNALQHYTPICQEVVRIIRLHGKRENGKLAIEEIRSAMGKEEARLKMVRDRSSNSDDRFDTLERKPFWESEEKEKYFVTPFCYSALQLATNLGLAAVVGYFVNELQLSPFVVPFYALKDPCSGEERDSMHLPMFTGMEKSEGPEKKGFVYNLRKDARHFFRDLFNYSEDKWCCSPYRLAIRSFNCMTVSVYLKLFQNTPLYSTSNASKLGCLTDSDIQIVAGSYQRNFGIDSKKVQISLQAVDYREPSWVDSRGCTALQEMLSDHLYSRLSADENEEGKHSGQRGAAELHQLSSLELYRGNIRSSSRAIVWRLLRSGAAVSGCFNNEGLDAWLIAFNLTEEAGKAATSLLLASGAALLGNAPSYQTDALSPTLKMSADIVGFPKDIPETKISLFSEEERLLEEVQVRRDELMTLWKRNGFGIPYSYEKETYERLVPTPSNNVYRSEEEGSISLNASGFEEKEVIRGQEKRKDDVLSSDEKLATFSKSDVLEGIPTQLEGAIAHDTLYKDCPLEEVLNHYIIFLLFSCVEHNSGKLIDLLNQYSTVLPTTERHPFTHDSLCTRLLKITVNQLVVLKELPAPPKNEQLENSANIGYHAGVRSKRRKMSEVIFGSLAGSTTSLTNPPMGALSPGSRLITFTSKKSDSTASMSEKLLEGDISYASQGAYNIPAVRKLLDVAKELIDNFDLGNRFEPSGNGDTLLSLAAIIGFSPLVARIVLPSQRESIGGQMSFSRKSSVSSSTNDRIKTSTTSRKEYSPNPQMPLSESKLQRIERYDEEVDKVLSPIKVGNPSAFELPTATSSSPRATKEAAPPNMVFNLSTALDDETVRMCLASRFYWVEEDAPALYVLLDNMNDVEKQLNFLSTAYPNIHPLPALWIATQYVFFASVVLRSPQANIAFWANILYAQFTGRLSELPVSSSTWNDLLHELLPRSPAAAIYLIQCYASELSDCGAKLQSPQRRAQEFNSSRSSENPTLQNAFGASMDSRNSLTARRAVARYPPLKVQQVLLSQTDLTHSAGLKLPLERTLSEVSISAIGASPSSPLAKPAAENNWYEISKRVSDFLKVSAMLVADSFLSVGRHSAHLKADEKIKSGAKKSPAPEEVPPTVGLTGTLLLDVLEVAARFDQSEMIFDLLRIGALIPASKEPVEGEKDRSFEGLEFDDLLSKRDEEQGDAIWRAVILSTCPTIVSCLTLYEATSTLKNLEKLLWKELIDVKHLDLIAVAAGSKNLLERLYQDEITSQFVSILRYDRINILNGLPEGMTRPTVHPDEIRALPGFTDSGVVGILTTMIAQAARASRRGEYHGSLLKGWLREYLLTSLREIGKRFTGLGLPKMEIKALISKAIHEEATIFCRRINTRESIGTVFARNEIARSSWGVGAATKTLGDEGAQTNTIWTHRSLGESGKDLLGLGLGFMGEGVPSVRLLQNEGRRVEALHASIVMDVSETPLPPPPKPVYQIFFQTDWVIHSSMVLRSPRPSMKTIDVLLLLLEKRCPLTISALKLFFAASHFTNHWRSSEGEMVTFHHQTHSHRDTLLHILVINDQYQLVEYYLSYTLYYFSKLSYDDPNLKPGIFPIKEVYPGWEFNEDGEAQLSLNGMPNELGEERTKEPFTFLRLMLRLNRHGLTAFDYASSQSMLQLLQRFGCVPPTYRPNPSTFTRALGLSDMLQNRARENEFFNVPQIVLSSENFLRFQDGMNGATINRLAGMKGNEQAKIRHEKALAATFHAAALGKNKTSNPTPAPSRLSKLKEVENTGDGALLKHLLATQRMTGALVLPLILNEDVSLFHLGLCAHDDLLVQMYGARRFNLKRLTEKSSAEPPNVAKRKEQETNVEGTQVVVPSFAGLEGEDEEKQLFSPYTLSLLPPDVISNSSAKSPLKGTWVRSGSKLPGLELGAAIPATGDHRASKSGAAGPRSSTTIPTKGMNGLVSSQSSKAKVALSQRDIVTMLEKRQFVVYPLSLPPQPVVDLPVAGEAEAAVKGGKNEKSGKKSNKARVRSVASVAAMTEGVFMEREMKLQMSNAEEVVEETKEMYHSSLMVSMTPMQLALTNLKSAGGMKAALSNQYYSVPAAKLKTFFSVWSLPKDVERGIVERRTRVAESLASINEDTNRVVQNLLMFRGGNETSNPSQEVVTVPLLQPQPFSVGNTIHLEPASFLEGWLKTKKTKTVGGSGQREEAERKRKKRKTVPGDTSVKKMKSNVKLRDEDSSLASGRRIESKASERRDSKQLSLYTYSVDSRGGRETDLDEMSGEDGDEIEVEVSAIHSVKPEGGIASPEQQSLMRILLRQFASSAGGKLSSEMGLKIGPNYDVERMGDPVALMQKSGLKKSEK